MSDDVFDDDDFNLDDDVFDVDFDAGLVPEGVYAGSQIESAEYKVNPEKNNSKGINFTLKLSGVDEKIWHYIWLGSDDKSNRRGLNELGAVIKAVTGEAPVGNFSLKSLNPVRTGDKTFFSAFEGALVTVTIKHGKRKDQTMDQFVTISADE